MDKRQHNIFFHLHTVSGIVISVLLFVIFFAGSFSFFRAEFINWERNDVVPQREGIHFKVDPILKGINDTLPLYGRDISMGRRNNEDQIFVKISGQTDSLASEKEKESKFFYVSGVNNNTSTYEESYTMGEFIYRLHFFSQLPVIGHYLSGLVALFFMFAIMTGVLVHWKKIVSNFFLFRPKEILKRVWSDGHTALGLIGLPFQFVYAVTGVFFMLRILLLIPTVSLMYGGDQEKLFEDLGFAEPKYELVNQPITKPYSLDLLVDKTNEKWKGFTVSHFHIYNYGDLSMRAIIDGEVHIKEQFVGHGGVTYEMLTGKEEDVHDPKGEQKYATSLFSIVNTLHFGSYGGLELRVISFVLGLVTCFVIISGVLIWIEARRKQKIPEKRKRFNERVGQVYLAICLSMLPVTAFSFILAKLIPHVYGADKLPIYYWAYFIVWLMVSLFFILKKDNAFTNRMTLISGGVIGVFIPIVNGVMTDSWIWDSLFTNHDFFVVDTLWLVIGSLSLFYGLKLSIKSKQVMSTLSVKEESKLQIL